MNGMLATIIMIGVVIMVIIIINRKENFGSLIGSMDSMPKLKNSETSLFLNNYPNSEKAKNINDLIDELNYKLEFKAYENARQYFKMADYKAAAITFDNFINDFPATKLKSKVYNYILKSKSELAIYSKYDLKKKD